MKSPQDHAQQVPILSEEGRELLGRFLESLGLQPSEAEGDGSNAFYDGDNNLPIFQEAEAFGGSQLGLIEHELAHSTGPR